MSVDMLQLKRSVVLNPPPASNLSAYPEHSLPSYLDPTHPLNADPTPLAIWQFEDKQLVDCNEPFARMLGYDGVPEFLLSFNVLTFYDIIAASIREKVVQTCADAFAKNIRYLERPALFLHKDGSEMKVFVRVTYHGSQFVTSVRVPDSSVFANFPDQYIYLSNPR
eukprot:Phypoly_transcript_19335.p1 GENE.Phypoly_transcript_19335~~Phypoly_transcript_19335.p1  ORF type:complete len:173 (+),score=24.52 Phypoly_transcript_19335:24-521(+)